MNFGKSRAKMLSPDAKKVTFDDVAGADEEGRIRRSSEILKSPSRYIEMGARIPKGVWLVGPPGTGKTLLARAIARRSWWCHFLVYQVLTLLKCLLELEHLGLETCLNRQRKIHQL